jgi:hypothetical protein
LPENDGPPVRVKLLSERLVASRDSKGCYGLIDEFCAHCGAPARSRPGNSRPSRDTPSRRTIARGRIMCDLDAAASTADFSAELDETDALSASGIVRREGRFVIMTEMGWPFVRLVAAAFDACLPKHRPRHSVAV